jgi:glycosyltransferase involved in cell wall biosynthesis
MTTVAVITRTQNRPLFLERAIKSIHNQSFTDFVHVIINDAGDPGPVDALVEKYKDLLGDRVKVIHNAESHGMEAASNKAIKSVNSEYIAIHDDDDTWHKDFLKLAVIKLKEVDAVGVVVRTDKVTEQVSADGNKIAKVKSEQWMPDLRVINLYRQCIDNQMTPITFLYKRVVFDKIGYYDESLPVLGDWDFGIRFLQKYDVEFLDPGYALAFYHHRNYMAGSTSNNSFGDGNERHRYWSNKLMNKYLREELANGRLGVGYIMSQLKYNQGYLSAMIKNVLPKFIVARLRNKVVR